MSLKAFHIFFITLAGLLSLGCGVWGFKSWFAPEPRLWQLWFGIGAVALGIALMVYGRNFLKKTRNVSYL